MVIWHVWSDGSCQHGVPQARKGCSGFGGWAAVVEHGSDGTVYRGRAAKTTNVRMELVAATQGLRAVREGARCVLHVDCTTVVAVFSRSRNGKRLFSVSDGDLWIELAAEFHRLDCSIDLLGKGARHPLHRRAHVIAGAEARAGLRNLPFGAVPLDDDHRLRQGMRRATVRAWRDDVAKRGGRFAVGSR